MYYNSPNFVPLQEKKLQDEIHQLNADVKERDIYIDGRKKEIELLQLLISQSRDGFNDYKAQRDKLQDERKYEFVTCVFYHEETKIML